MAVCGHCDREMLEASGCTKAVVPLRIGVEVRDYERIRFQDSQDPFRVPDERCHDCNAERGELHHRRCDVETCPRCKGQLISCDCVAPADHKLTESQWKELMDHE